MALLLWYFCGAIKLSLNKNSRKKSASASNKYVGKDSVRIRTSHFLAERLMVLDKMIWPQNYKTL